MTEWYVMCLYTCMRKYACTGNVHGIYKSVKEKNWLMGEMAWYLTRKGDNGNCCCWPVILWKENNNKICVLISLISTVEGIFWERGRCAIQKKKYI